MIFKGKEKKFWNWFEKNKQRLNEFIASEDKDYSVYEELNGEIKKYNELLFAEITIEDETPVLIITPDGMKDGYEPTVKLTDNAPDVEGWKIIRFRQPSDSFNIKMGDKELSMEDFKVLREFDEEHVHLALCINGFVENDNQFITLGFLALDHLLGEFNVITRVGQIDFFGFDFLTQEHDSISLLELRKEIEENLY